MRVAANVMDLASSGDEKEFMWRKGNNMGIRFLKGLACLWNGHKYGNTCFGQHGYSMRCVKCGKVVLMNMKIFQCRTGKDSGLHSGPPWSAVAME